MWCFAPTSHTGACATDQDEKQALGDPRLGQIFLGEVVLALPCRTVDHGNVVGFGITANATAEPAGQPHQVGIFERLIRSGQCPPPHTEPARIMAHAEVRIQNNAIDAIVATAQQILIESAQPVRHGRQVKGTLPQLQTAPQGPLFRSLVCEKA